MIIKYIGEYRVELQTGPIKNSGYRIYKASWQTHKNKKPVFNSRPRWKLISTYQTLEECESHIRQLQAGEITANNALRTPR